MICIRWRWRAYTFTSGSTSAAATAFQLMLSIIENLPLVKYIWIVFHVFIEAGWFDGFLYIRFAQYLRLSQERQWGIVIAVHPLLSFKYARWLKERTTGSFFSELYCCDLYSMTMAVRLKTWPTVIAKSEWRLFEWNEENYLNSCKFEYIFKLQRKTGD